MDLCSGNLSESSRKWADTPDTTGYPGYPCQMVPDTTRIPRRYTRRSLTDTPGYHRIPVPNGPGYTCGYNPGCPAGAQGGGERRRPASPGDCRSLSRTTQETAPDGNHGTERRLSREHPETSESTRTATEPRGTAPNERNPTEAHGTARACERTRGAQGSRCLIRAGSRGAGRLRGGGRTEQCSTEPRGTVRNFMGIARMRTGAGRSRESCA